MNCVLQHASYVGLLLVVHADMPRTHASEEHGSDGFPLLHHRSISAQVFLLFSTYVMSFRHTVLSTQVKHGMMRYRHRPQFRLHNQCVAPSRHWSVEIYSSWEFGHPCHCSLGNILNKCLLSSFCFLAYFVFPSLQRTDSHGRTLPPHLLYIYACMH